MAGAPGRDRVGSWSVVVGVVALVATTIALYLTSLLWTVGAPTAVAMTLLLVAVAPTVVYAVRRGGRAWLVPVVLVGAAVFIGQTVLRDYEPSGAVVRAVFANTPLPTWRGAGTVTVSDDCRYWCFLNDGPTGTSVGLEVTSDDVQGTCLQLGKLLVADGWSLGPPVANSDWCLITVTRPAPLGRTYVIDLSISPDHLLPVDDIATGPPQPGRVFTGIRVV
jgi:hypothetical protein